MSTEESKKVSPDGTLDNPAEMSQPTDDQHEEPPINDTDVLEEEQERRKLMLEVIARSLDNFTQQRRKDLNLHKDDLKANEFDHSNLEDTDTEQHLTSASQLQADKQTCNDMASEQKAKKRMDVYIPTENSLITEILMETQPLEKIEKNLFAQYLKAKEPLPAGQPRRPLPKFLTKMLAKEKTEREDGFQEANKDCTRSTAWSSTTKWPSTFKDSCAASSARFTT